MQCPNCHGTGHERDYEPWDDCPDCDGAGSVPDDDGERDADRPWFMGGTECDAKLACGCYADWNGSAWVVSASYFLCNHKQGERVTAPSPRAANSQSGAA